MLKGNMWGKSVFLGAAICLALAPGAAYAQAKIDAFMGQWTGGGVAETKSDSRFQLAARELDIEIKPAGSGGFEISWSTLHRQKNEQGRAAPEVKSSTLVFAPSGEAQWSAESESPLKGGQLAWARLEDNSLIVRTFTINEDGSGEHQLYRRTLAGDSMELFYVRSLDGELMRTAMGRLNRKGK